MHPRECIFSGLVGFRCSPLPAVNDCNLTVR